MRALITVVVQSMPCEASIWGNPEVLAVLRLNIRADFALTSIREDMVWWEMEESTNCLFLVNVGRITRIFFRPKNRPKPRDGRFCFLSAK